MNIPYDVVGKNSLNNLRRNTAKSNQIQRELLFSLLKKNKDTVYGRKYGFAEINSLHEYQQKVPISEYGDYDTYIQEMIEGKEAVLTAEAPAYYCISSGSTSEPKYLPVSEADILVHKHYAYEAIFGMVQEYYSDLLPEQIFGKIFQTGEFARTYTDQGIMNGIRSSSLYQWMDKDNNFDASDYCVPKEVLFPEELEDLIYIKVRFALAEMDIRAIHGVFIHRMVGVLSYIETQWELLLNDIEHGTIDESIPLNNQWKEKIKKWLPPNAKRAKELRQIPLEQLKSSMITKIWKNVKYVLTIGGSGFSSYMEQLREYSGDIPIHYFAYAASEGIFGVAKEMNCQDQYILIPDSGIFEFTPMGGGAKHPLSIEEVEIGKKYSFVFTNQSGLYRYDLMDVVEVVGFHGQAPIIRFCYRKNQVISIADERTNTEQLEKAMQLFSEATKIDITHYGIEADYSVQPGRYLIYLENTTATKAIRYDSNTTEIDHIMEQCLQKSTLGYAGCRKMKEISPVHVEFLFSGSFARYEEHLATTGRIMGQNKPLRILDSAEKCAFFAREIDNSLD